jgi:single-strand DNA-binding protein
MNIFTFSGNLGADSEVRNTPQGKSVLSFRVAVKSGYGDREQTLWIDCSLWGKQAEGKLPDLLKKGATVAVFGELSTREYEGKTYLQVNAGSVDVLKFSDKSTPEPQKGGAQDKFEDFTDDSLPF